MDLHRSTSQPEWSGVTKLQQNFWQRLAQRSSGVVTPGNFFTIIGLAGVFTGLYLFSIDKYALGLLILAAGRFCDVLDGWAAQSTGTKSPLGERMDAIADKIGTAATVVGFVALSLLPWWLAILLILPHIIISVLTIYGLRRAKKLHPSPIGKLSMALAWITLLGFVLVHIISNGQNRSLLSLVYILSFASIIMGNYAALGYRRQIIN